MKIAFIASYPPSLLNFRLSLMQLFQSLGACVIAIGPADAEVARTLASYDIKYITVSMQRNGLNPVVDFFLMLQLWKIFIIEKPNIIFTYTIKPIIYGSIAARLAHIPYIYSLVTGTGYLFSDVNHKKRWLSSLASRLLRIALHFNTLVYFQNKDNLNRFLAQKIIAKTKSTAIVNGSGVNCHHFMPTPYPTTITFLMIARFLYDKGILEYIAAARLIKKKYPHIYFHLVGWIDSNPNAITQAELNAWIEEGTIQYLGQLNDVRPAIGNASVYVLPSYHEGTPRTVLEAMAMARPIITTEAPGCKETVNHGKNGFLVPIKNVQALFVAMEYFILSPQLIISMGNESRKLCTTKYEVDLVNNSILKAMFSSQRFSEYFPHIEIKSRIK